MTKVGWPACGELDVVEVNGKNPYLVSGYSHGPHKSHEAYLALPEPIAAGFHVYGIEWTPQVIIWTVDGRAYSRLYKYTGWPFDHPFFLLLDLAVGGKWPGSPRAATKFPARMFVDWVRVYRLS